MFGQEHTLGSAELPQDGECVREDVETQAKTPMSSVITEQLIQLENENKQLKGEVVSIWRPSEKQW